MTSKIFKNEHTACNVTNVLCYNRLFEKLFKGTTWLDEIVWLLISNLDFKNAVAKSWADRVLWLDIGFSKDILDEIESPRVFKSHLLPKYLPDNFNKRQKVIYIARNPKDVIVSSQAFYKNINGVGDYNLNDIVEFFTNDRLLYGSWCKHVDSYFNMQDVHFIQYEHLVKVSRLFRYDFW
jgi:hypothetical protein